MTTNQVFKTTGVNLKAKANETRAFNSPDHEARASMLAHIGDLFISISKRSDIFYRVRNDGVEVMFYNDLAAWLLDVAPNLTPPDSDAMLAYKNLLEYCKKIDLSVINNYSRDENRNSPSSTLQRIIAFLQNYHDKLHASNCARSFNTLIRDMDRKVLTMASKSLDILYALIDSEISSVIPYLNKYSNKTFMIDKFMNPDSTDSKIKAIRNTQLGEWLYETAEMVGLTYTKYEPTKPLSLAEIKKHLLGKHPADGAQFQPSSLKSGLRRFDSDLFQSAESILDEERHLLKIRDIYRLTLQLYHISQSLIKGSKVTEEFGDSWIYGHPAGLATLGELLDHINEATDNYLSVFQDFWADYYTSGFVPLSNANHLSRVNNKNGPLTTIELTIKKEINTLKESITLLIEEIKQKSIHYANNSSKIEQSKLDFMSSVLECRNSYKKTSSKNYQRLKSELEQFKQQTNPLNYGTTCAAASSEKMGASVIPKDNRLASALDCLTNRKPRDCEFDDKYKTIPNIPNNHFYSTLQRDVFNTIIKNYNNLVNSPFLSGAICYNSEQFSALRYRYICLYDAYSKLYSNELNQSSDVELSTFKQENQDAIGLFDLELTKFMLHIDLQRLLFKQDSLSVLPEILKGKQNAVQMERNSDGSYTIEQNNRYRTLKTETKMRSIMESQAEQTLNLKKRLDDLRKERMRNPEQHQEYRKPSLNADNPVPENSNQFFSTKETKPVAQPVKVQKCAVYNS